jgi:hypothetical protein
MCSLASNDLFIAIVAAVLGALLTLLIQWLTRRDSYRQGAYTERARAVQDLLNHARAVKDSCVRAQAVAQAPEASAAIQAVEAAKVALMRQAFFHDVWISEDRGVRSVRDFNSRIDGAQMQKLDSRQAVEAALESPFTELRQALKKDLGFQPR